MSSNDELDDLLTLVNSAGFARFKDHVEREWGDAAQMRKIDDVLKALGPGNPDAELTTVSQVRAAARQIQQMVEWPTRRIAQLKTEAKPSRLNPMDAIRRIGR